jgi:predicted HicB family RNase H-like nuclease
MVINYHDREEAISTSDTEASERAGAFVMKNIMEHEGYRASIEYDDESDTFFGTVVGISDLIMFEGASIQELHNSFAESLDDYLAMCKENNKSPEKAFSGTFNVRIPPKTHQQLVLLASSKRQNLNAVVNEALEFYCAQ